MAAHDDIHDMPQLEVLLQRLNAGALCVLARSVAGWLNHSRQRRALAEVDEGLPRDSGLTHSVARSEAAKPFCYAGQACRSRSAHQKEEVMYDDKNTARMMLDPNRAFKRPMDVVEAEDIGVAEKLAILEAWEADERALQRAEDEGMGGGEHAHLQKVQTALAHLRDVEEVARFSL